MNVKKNIAETVKIVLPLFLICTLMVFLIAICNAVTSPVIERNKQKTFDRSIATLFSIASTENLKVEKLSFPSNAPATLISAHRIYNEDLPIGYLMEVDGIGAYSGKIRMLVALDCSGRIIDLLCSEQSETPGKGDRVLNAQFYSEHYIGKSNQEISVSPYPALSGSTKTSDALYSAVNTALEGYALLSNDATGGPS